MSGEWFLWALHSLSRIKIRITCAPWTPACFACWRSLVRSSSTGFPCGEFETWWGYTTESPVCPSSPPSGWPDPRRWSLVLRHRHNQTSSQNRELSAGSTAASCAEVAAGCVLCLRNLCRSVAWRQKAHNNKQKTRKVNKAAGILCTKRLCCGYERKIVVIGWSDAHNATSTLGI